MNEDIDRPINLTEVDGWRPLGFASTGIKFDDPNALRWHIFLEEAGIDAEYVSAKNSVDQAGFFIESHGVWMYTYYPGVQKTPNSHTRAQYDGDRFVYVFGICRPPEEDADFGIRVMNVGNDEWVDVDGHVWGCLDGHVDIWEHPRRLAVWRDSLISTAYDKATSKATDDARRANTRWSDYDEGFMVNLFDLGVPVNDIALWLGRTKSSIGSRLMKNGRVKSTSTPTVSSVNFDAFNLVSGDPINAFVLGLCLKRFRSATRVTSISYEGMSDRLQHLVWLYVHHPIVRSTIGDPKTNDSGRISLLSDIIDQRLRKHRALSQDVALVAPNDVSRENHTPWAWGVLCSQMMREQRGSDVVYTVKGPRQLLQKVVTIMYACGIDGMQLINASNSWATIQMSPSQVAEMAMVVDNDFRDIYHLSHDQVRQVWFDAERANVGNQFDIRPDDHDINWMTERMS